MVSFLYPTIGVYHTTQSIINDNNNNNNWVHPILRASILSLPCNLIVFPSSNNHTVFSPIYIHRSFRGPHLNPRRSILRSSPGPPPGNESQRSTGIVATFSRLWDTVQIFFAVLFWMSLFFWASASDGKNTGSRNKRDRFRK